MPKKQSAPARRYPPPEEIPQIIRRRNQMMQRLLLAIVLREDDEPAAERMMADLMEEYGRPEVIRMLARVQESLDRPDDLEAEATQLYDAYVRTWRRFGRGLPLFSAVEHQRLVEERADLLGKPMLHDQELTDAEQARINLIGNQILAEPHLWDDLYPPDPPPEATQASGQRPAQARPGRNDPCWCGSGRKYKHCHLRADSAGDG